MNLLQVSLHNHPENVHKTMPWEPQKEDKTILQLCGNFLHEVVLLLLSVSVSNEKSTIKLDFPERFCEHCVICHAVSPGATCILSKVNVMIAIDVY